MQQPTIASQPNHEINMDDDERALWAEVDPVSILFVFIQKYINLAPIGYISCTESKFAMRPLAVTLGMIPGPYMEGGSEGETRDETL